MGKGMKAGKRKPVAERTHAGGGAASQQAQLAQIAKMQEQMDKVQAELEEKEIETTAGGGAVSVKVNGKKEIVSLVIDKDAIDPEDPETLQDLIIVAVNEGLRQIEEISSAEMEKVTGGLNLPF